MSLPSSPHTFGFRGVDSWPRVRVLRQSSDVIRVRNEAQFQKGGRQGPRDSKMSKIHNSWSLKICFYISMQPFRHGSIMINTKCLLCQDVLLRRQNGRLGFSMQGNSKIPGQRTAGNLVESTPTTQKINTVLGGWEPEVQGGASLLQRRGLCLGHWTISTL